MAAWSLPEAERLRAASTVACRGTVASATRQHPQDPYEMRRREAIIIEHRGGQLRPRRASLDWSRLQEDSSTGSGVLSGGGPRSTAVANHHRWPRGLVDRGRSSTAAAASAGRRCSGSSAAAGRERATVSSRGSIGSADSSKAAAARAVQWRGNGSTAVRVR